MLFRNTIYCYSEIQFTIQRYNLLLFRNTIYWSRWFTQTFQTPSSSITSQFLELPQLGMIPTFQGKLDKSKSKKVFKAVIKTKLSRGGLLQYDPVFIVLDQGEKVINPNHRLESPSRWNLKPIYFSNQIWQKNKVFWIQPCLDKSTQLSHLLSLFVGEKIFHGFRRPPPPLTEENVIFQKWLINWAISVVEFFFTERGKFSKFLRKVRIKQKEFTDSQVETQFVFVLAAS